MVLPVPDELCPPEKLPPERVLPELNPLDDPVPVPELFPLPLLLLPLLPPDDWPAAAAAAASLLTALPSCRVAAASAVSSRCTAASASAHVIPEDVYAAVCAEAEDDGVGVAEPDGVGVGLPLGEGVGLGDVAQAVIAASSAVSTAAWLLAACACAAETASSSD